MKPHYSFTYSQRENHSHFGHIASAEVPLMAFLRCMYMNSKIDDLACENVPRFMGPIIIHYESIKFHAM